MLESIHAASSGYAKHANELQEDQLFQHEDPDKCSPFEGAVHHGHHCLPLHNSQSDRVTLLRPRDQERAPAAADGSCSS